MVEFVQAGISIQQEKEFGELRAALGRVLSPGSVESFLRDVRRKGLRVRQLEQILAAGIFERVDRDLPASGRKATQLYNALTLSDQGQMRELYLTEVEKIGAALRAKYHTQFETF